MNLNTSLSRRRLLTLGGGAAAGLTLAACGTGPAGSTNSQSSSGGGGNGGKLEVWGTSPTIGDSDGPLQQAATEFGEANGVTLSFQGIPSADLASKLTTTAAGGTGPDVVIIDVSSVAQLAASQALADISDSAAAVADEHGE